METNHKKENPIVSVIVATYRREDTLKRAIESLLKQDYENVEIVVVNDNAEKQWDEKVDAIISGFNDDPRITYIKNEENIGSAKTRNKGIDAAKGEYVTFLDDDDIYLPNKVSRQVNFMIEKKLDYCLTDLHLYAENGVLFDRRIRSFIKKTDPKSLMVYHVKYHMAGTDTMMFKKEYIEAIGKFAHIDACDEFYLMERAILGKGRFAYLPGCDLIAYIHTGEGGLSSGDIKIQGENILYNHKKRYFKYLTKKDLRFVKMRHYAVIAYAELRRKKYVPFMINAAKSFFSSPIDTFVLIKSHMGK